MNKTCQEAEEDFGTGKFSGHQKYLWDLMEHSDSSTLAQVVSVTSISFVAVSIVGMIVNTLESLQYTVYHRKESIINLERA